MANKLDCVCIAWVLTLIFVVGAEGQGEVGNNVYRIPRVSDVKVDGSGEDWGGGGFLVDVMADVEGGFRAPGDFDPKLRLGWNEAGLLILAQVSDDGFSESDIDRRLFLADSLEFFIGTSRDEHDYFMLLVAPGVDPKHPEQRHIFFDERNGGPVAAGTLPELQADIKAGLSAGGYTIEALVPWSNLDLAPRAGMHLAFQAYAMDRDPGEPEADTFRVAWYPAFDTHQNQTTSMMTLELAESASEPVRAVVRGRFRDIEVVAHENSIGHSLRIERDGEPLAETSLIADAGRATGSVRLPAPPPGEPLGQLSVFLDNQLLEVIERGSASAMMGVAIEEGMLGFFQHVFSGSTFPTVEFVNPRLVEDLIGPFEIVVRYYSPDLQEVTLANTPGRYGAVVTVKPVGGDGKNSVRATSRFFSLFRTPDDQVVVTRKVPSWVMPDLDTVTLPGGLTLAPELQGDEETLDESDAIRRAAEWEHFSVSGDRGTDAVDAGLADQLWWVRCKRVYYGISNQSVRVPLPRPSEPGDGGFQLREGSPEEAGLEPGIVGLLEDICSRWTASNGGRGFTVCAARHGVAFFHRAYGRFEGETVTLATPSRVHSVSKPVTGTVLMAYMDQGLVDLDAPIGSYLPLFRGMERKPPLTIRQLMTHTSGLSGHFGDEQRDLEERVADEYPLLENPVPHLYSGRGFALAVKVLEGISAETFPEIYNRVLFQPLGMSNTTATNSHNGVYTTAWDLAKMGQLLLNKGCYGGRRYFSPATLEQAKPKPLVEIFGPNTKLAWGIGFWGSRESGRRMLGGTAFGHNSSNSSLFRVDSETDLVVTVSSFEDRRYLTDAMRREFIQAIEAAIVDAP